MNKPDSKTIYILVGVFVIVMIATAANLKRNPVYAPETQELESLPPDTMIKDDNEVMPDEPEHEPGDAVESSDVTWTVSDARDRGETLVGSESRWPLVTQSRTTQGRFVEVTVTAENSKDKTVTVQAPRIIDDENREYQHRSFELRAWLPRDEALFNLEQLPPDVPKDFVLIYEVAPDAENLKLKVGTLRPQLINLGL